jgi:hypothetical protein
MQNAIAAILPQTRIEVVKVLIAFTFSKSQKTNRAKITISIGFAMRERKSARAFQQNAAAHVLKGLGAGSNKPHGVAPRGL